MIGGHDDLHFDDSAFLVRFQHRVVVVSLSIPVTRLRLSLTQVDGRFVSRFEEGGFK